MTTKQAYQEFFDNAFHRSIKPEISEEAKAVAMKALQEKMKREDESKQSVERCCKNCLWYKYQEELGAECDIHPGIWIEPDDYCSKFNPKEEPSK